MERWRFISIGLVSIALGALVVARLWSYETHSVGVTSGIPSAEQVRSGGNNANTPLHLQPVSSTNDSSGTLTGLVASTTHESWCPIGATCPKSFSEVTRLNPRSGEATYASKTLGISFQYWQDGTVIVAESTNTITISSPNSQSPQDLIVMFRKDSSGGFEQSITALEAQFGLNCNFTFAPEVYLPPQFDQEASVQYENAASDCGGYDADGSLFVYSAKYPDRFYFLEYGQSFWPEAGDNAGPDDSWINTIRLSAFDS